jgi:hypothetical protein
VERGERFMGSAGSEVRNVILAGCGRSGTTSIFQMLTTSPEIDHSKRKTTAFFMRALYEGQSLNIGEYGEHFGTRPNSSVQLEATHAYFYASPEVPQSILNLLRNPLIILIFREPYSRLVSEFSYLKSRFLVDQQESFEEFVDSCLASSAHEFRESNPLHLGVRKGLYYEHFPDWAERFGSSLKVLFFDDLQSDPQKVIRELTDWIGIRPIQVPKHLEEVNKGMAYRVPSLQRGALAVNNLLEPLFRKHPTFKTAIRHVYCDLNGVPPESVERLTAGHPVFDMYRSGLDAFSDQLVRWNPNIELPCWLLDRSNLYPSAI